MIYRKPFSDSVKMELYLQLWPPAVDNDVIALIPAETDEESLIVEGKHYFALARSLVASYYNVLTGGDDKAAAPSVLISYPVDEIVRMTMTNNIVTIVKRS